MKTLLTVLVFAAAVWAGDNDGKVLSAEGGRYVFGQVNGQSRDMFMLDTQTGQLWQLASSSNGPLILEPVPYIIYTTENEKGHRFSLTPQQVTSK